MEPEEISDSKEIDKTINSVIIDSAYKNTVDRAMLYKAIKTLYEENQELQDRLENVHE